MQDLAAGRGIGGQQAASAFGKMDQDRAGFGERAAELRVDQHRHLAERVQRQEVGGELLALEDGDMAQRVGELKLLEHDHDLADVRAAHAIEEEGLGHGGLLILPSGCWGGGPRVARWRGLFPKNPLHHPSGGPPPRGPAGRIYY